MKKLVFLPFAFLLIAGCNSFASENKIPIEMVAFDSLSKAEQDLIPASPKDSTVVKEPVTNEVKSLIDTTYDEEQLYSVVFNNTQKGTSGNLVVYVSIDRKTVVGKGVKHQE